MTTEWPPAPTHPITFKLPKNVNITQANNRRTNSNVDKKFRQDKIKEIFSNINKVERIMELIELKFPEFFLIKDINSNNKAVVEFTEQIIRQNPNLLKDMNDNNPFFQNYKDCVFYIRDEKAKIKPGGPLMPLEKDLIATKNLQEYINTFNRSVQKNISNPKNLTTYINSVVNRMRS